MDGRPLALVPPRQREDSVALCYDGTQNVGSVIHVRVRTPNGERQFDLRPTDESRYVHITPERAPYASLERDAPLLD